MEAAWSALVVADETEAPTGTDEDDAARTANIGLEREGPAGPLCFTTCVYIAELRRIDCTPDTAVLLSETRRRRRNIAG
jgi:hypothetical protein